jgi:hypothetical protein
MGLFDFLKRKEFEKIRDLTNKLERYSKLISIEEEEVRLSNELENLKLNFSELKEKYSNSIEVYKNLKHEIGVFENKLDLIEFGIYEPVFDFEKSDHYREEQKRIAAKLEQMISEDLAASCETNWTVQGSESKGKAVVKIYKKLMLRAFNGECDILISKVKWNNVNQMRERINKLFNTVNKLGVGFHVTINESYRDLKIKELLLEFEYQEKKQQEKEEQRLIQEELREEEKARREYEKAQKDAEKEEATYTKALEKARKEFEEATGEKHIKLQEQIARLEQELKEAQEKKERALSMAQQTKRGHVYVISNIGSFGENVYKIGMTRRLEPIDRIKELGDASVPFQFDVHAMIFAEDAPTLENELHKAFTDRKVNMLNYRKEFFNVSLDEIEAKITETGLNAEFTRMPEAMEYRETLAILEKLRNQAEGLDKDIEMTEQFPSSL